MGDRKNQRRELPSVLDRLIDEDPEQRQEKPQTIKQMAETLRDAVRRDLEYLVNARLRPSFLPEGLDELESSSFEYGIPDFSGANMTTAERRRKFLRNVEEIIRRNEPRFSSVKVIPMDSHSPLLRNLDFRIEAVLRTEPMPESVLYDSQIDILTRSFRISSDG